LSVPAFYLNDELTLRRRDMLRIAAVVVLVAIATSLATTLHQRSGTQ
jgi:hypothetical protein